MASDFTGTAVAGLRRAGWAIAALGVLAAGCAGTGKPPDCPDAQLRRFDCGGGVRTLTYDAAIDPSRYCQAVTELQRGGSAQRSDRPLMMTDGNSVMYVGLSGWLLFPPPKYLPASPGEVGEWFRLRNCVPVPPA